MVRMARNVSFVLLAILALSTQAVVRADDECQYDDWNYYDGFNANGSDCSSAACHSYCENNPNAGGGTCTGFSASSCFAGTCGYCQCAGCVPG